MSLWGWRRWYGSSIASMQQRRAASRTAGQPCRQRIRSGRATSASRAQDNTSHISAAPHTATCNSSPTQGHLQASDPAGAPGRPCGHCSLSPPPCISCSTHCLKLDHSHYPHPLQHPVSAAHPQPQQEHCASASTRRSAHLVAHKLRQAQH